MKIFLDDYRIPLDAAKYMHTRIGPKNLLYLDTDWITVKTYEEFVNAVTKNINEITHVSFDHDLSDVHYNEDYIKNPELYNNCSEKTGKDCAEWMKNFYKEQSKKLPEMFIHSMNPGGVQRIIMVFI